MSAPLGLPEPYRATGSSSFVDFLAALHPDRLPTLSTETGHHGLAPHGTTIVAQSVLGIVNGWSIAKTADIDGDGKDDIVWQQPDGTAVVWFMDGAATTGAFTLSGPTTWRILPH